MYDTTDATCNHNYALYLGKVKFDYGKDWKCSCNCKDIARAAKILQEQQYLKISYKFVISSLLVFQSSTCTCFFFYITNLHYMYKHFKGFIMFYMCTVDSPNNGHFGT